MLYHISKNKGLKVLKLQVSTHQKRYIYAVENVVRDCSVHLMTILILLSTKKMAFLL